MMSQAQARSEVDRLLRTPVDHIKGGEYVAPAGGDHFETMNPATGEVLARAAGGTGADVDRAVDAARAAFDEGPWPHLSPQERRTYLYAIADAIERRAQDIGYVETLDTGQPISQMQGGQVPRAAQNFRYFADMAVNLPESVAPREGPFLNYTSRYPIGVAGLITPWNTPFMLETWKVAPCLAAGDTCVLKPAEWAPLSAQFLAEVTREAGLPPGVFNVVHGYGEPAGAALVAHPGVQLISFVGETTTGKEIMRNGAATLKRLMMELGGKGPVIVFADANVERALDATIFGVYSLNGERCTAGSRVLVEESLYDRFVEALAARVARIRVGDPLERSTEVGPLIHPEHAARVRSYIRLGQEEGARLVVGGERPAGLAEGNYVQPTLFSDVTRTMRIAREEIFGPVLCAMRFRSEEEALAMANDVSYGLAAYVWTENLGRGHRVAEGLQSGMVWVNSQNVRNLHTPFGGAKGSGMGRDGGRHSFDFYCEIKNISIALGDHPIPRFGAD
jgi:5-carboxymethyl-2-hydroxymuconic-semialdehyde dehydrogenase